MNLKDIMTPSVEVISPESSLKEAAAKMDEIDSGVLPVCENDRLVGIITDRDIVIRSVSAGQDPSEAKVRDAMTSPIHFCFDDQSTEEVAQMMKENQIKRVPVLSRAKRLVGIVSLGDLATQTRDKSLTGDVAEKISQPSSSQPSDSKGSKAA